MNTLKKILSATAILTIVLALSFSQLPTAHSEEISAKDKALAFITNVAGLDMTKYNITQASEDTLIPSGTVGIVDKVTHHILEYDGSKIEVICIYRNGSLYDYSLNVRSGSILSAQQPAANALESAKSFLGKYQLSSGASYLQPMNDLLNSVHELKPTTAISNNVKLSLSVSDNNAIFKFMYTFAGLDDRWKAVVFNINNGNLIGFGDAWNLYQIGSTDVNLSQEDAIRLATELAKNYTLQVYGPNGTLIDVPFSISENQTTANLSIQSKNNSLLYPFWHVQLYFDKWYYSNYGIEVGIWADNGQVQYLHPTGVQADAPDGGEPTPQPTIQPTPTAPVDSPNPTLEPTASPQPLPSQQVNPVTDSATSSPSPQQTAMPNSPQQIENNVSWLNVGFAVSAAALIAIGLVTAVVVKKRSK